MFSFYFTIVKNIFIKKLYKLNYFYKQMLIHHVWDVTNMEAWNKEIFESKSVCVY